ncbi:MAG TPA: ECF transporter S component [Candidatus Limnocylindria bacterium]|nr:ECF transporter S component [Candidatus Limnocylindria bacterium]
MTAVAQTPPSPSPWAITTRVIVYAAIGAALYAIFNWIAFAIQIPGTENVSVRPHYGLLTFFGFSFGPVVGFLTGFVGNTVGDQLAYGSAFGSWWWSVANGLAGLVAGLFPFVLASRMTSVGSKAAWSAVAGVVATIVGFLFIWIELIIQPELGFNTILTAEYIPVIVGNSIAAAIITPILVLAWEPISEQLGR